jgi:hypothetical protein
MPYEPLKIHLAAQRKEAEAEQRRIEQSFPILTAEEEEAERIAWENVTPEDARREAEEYWNSMTPGERDPRRPIAPPRLYLGDLLAFATIASEVRKGKRGGLTAGGKLVGMNRQAASELFKRVEDVLGIKLTVDNRALTVQGRNLAAMAQIMGHWYSLVFSKTDQEGLSLLLAEEYLRIAASDHAKVGMKRAGQYMIGPEDLPF